MTWWKRGEQSAPPNRRVVTILFLRSDHSEKISGATFSLLHSCTSTDRRVRKYKGVAFLPKTIWRSSFLHFEKVRRCLLVASLKIKFLQNFLLSFENLSFPRVPPPPPVFGDWKTSILCRGRSTVSNTPSLFDIGSKLKSSHGKSPIDSHIRKYCSQINYIGAKWLQLQP